MVWGKKKLTTAQDGPKEGNGATGKGLGGIVSGTVNSMEELARKVEDSQKPYELQDNDFYISEEEVGMIKAGYGVVSDLKKIGYHVVTYPARFVNKKTQEVREFKCSFAFIDYGGKYTFFKQRIPDAENLKLEHDHASREELSDICKKVLTAYEKMHAAKQEK